MSISSTMAQNKDFSVCKMELISMRSAIMKPRNAKGIEETCRSWRKMRMSLTAFTIRVMRITRKALKLDLSPFLLLQSY